MHTCTHRRTRTRAPARRATVGRPLPFTLQAAARGHHPIVTLVQPPGGQGPAPGPISAQL